MRIKVAKKVPNIGETAAGSPLTSQGSRPCPVARSPHRKIFAPLRDYSHALSVVSATKSSLSLACPIASLCNRPAHSPGKSFGSRCSVDFVGRKYEAMLLLEPVGKFVYQAAEVLRGQ